MPASSPKRASSLSSIRVLVWALAALFLAVWLSTPHHAFEGLASYLPLHNFLEGASIVVAMLVFGITWNAYTRERSGNLVIVACGLLAVGLIDFAHMLSFKGMPDFVTPADPEKAIEFWLAARLVFAACLLAAALRPAVPLAAPWMRHALLAAAAAVTAFVYWRTRSSKARGSPGRSSRRNTPSSRCSPFRPSCSTPVRGGRAPRSRRCSSPRRRSRCSAS
jgi:Membrane-associated sensor domain